MKSVIVLFMWTVYFGHDTTQASFITASSSTIFPGTTQSLTVECNIRPLLAALSDVFILQIEKTEDVNTVSLASITDKGVVLDSGYDVSRMNVTGDLDPVRQGPFIRLIIDNPTKADKGTYVCSVSTTDKTGILVNLSYQTTVTAADNIVDDLMNKMTNLTSEISNLKKENGYLITKLTDYQNRLTDLENKPCNCVSTNPSTSDTTLITQTLKEIQANFTSSQITYENRFSGLTNDIAVLQSNQSSIINDVMKVDQTSQSLVSNMFYTMTKFDLVEGRLKVVENISTEQYSEIAQLAADRTGQVFSYTYPTINPSTSVLSFGVKLTESVLSYDNQNGVFVAPRPGLYLFSLSIATESGSLYVAIKVRQELVAYAVTAQSGGVQQGSTSAVVRMSKGDTALVKISSLVQTPLILQKDACSFTGVFLGPTS